MTIDIQTDTLLQISDVSKHLPGKIHVASIWRWVNRGVRGVKLETVLIGGRRYTSAEALQRFIERTTRAADGEPAIQQARTSRQRQRAIDAANAELDQAGI